MKCLFSDPPDNIGLGYDTYNDKLADSKYVSWLHDLVKNSIRVADICWFSFNAKWTFAMGQIFHSLIEAFKDSDTPLTGKACVQVFTFGQHNKNDFGNNHRPLWRLMRADAKLYPDAVKVPSWRQRNGDKRAAAGGRVPGDVLDFQYPGVTASIGTWLASALEDATICESMKADIETWLEKWPGDVLDFPRVTGNSKQRCDWHPTQLHEELVERCIKLSVAPGDRVIDPFGGTGTTMRVCRRLGQPCTLFELDGHYCEMIAKTNELELTDTDWQGK